MKPEPGEFKQPAPLSDIRALIEKGEEDSAIEKLRSFKADQIANAELHRQLGELAEILGETSRAITEYNLSLRDDRLQPEVILRLARIRADRGEADRAIRAYRHYLKLKPDDVEIREEIVDFLETCGRSDLAHQFRSTDSNATQGVLSAQAAPDRRIAIEPSDTDFVMFSTLFSGREGVHARQWVSPTGRGGYSPVQEPFTPAVAKHHLLGTYTVGIYPVRMDNTVLFMAWDIDINKRFMGKRGFGSAIRETHEAAKILIDFAASMDIPTLLEDSGHKGRHVWILFAQPVPAAAARRIGAAFMAHLGSRAVDVSIELFPKQSRVSSGSLGNLIKLPLGIHRVTGRRSLFLDPATGQPFQDQLAALHGYPRLERKEVSRIIERLSNPGGSTPTIIPFPGQGASIKHVSAEPVKETYQTIETDMDLDREAEEQFPPVTVVPEKPPFDLDNDIEYLTIINRCAVLAEIIRKIETDGVISSNERLVLTYSLGHLKNGPEIVNTLLNKTLTVSPDAFLKSRLRGNPISCPRIRERLRDLTASVSCDCRFDPDTGMYPSPVLHLADIRKKAMDTAGTQINRLNIDRLIMDLIRARARAETARRLAQNIENQVINMMKELSLDQINTSAGTVFIENGTLNIDLSGKRNAFAVQEGNTENSEIVSTDDSLKEEHH